jgi:hypothetical protein
VVTRALGVIGLLGVCAAGAALAGNRTALHVVTLTRTYVVPARAECFVPPEGSKIPSRPCPRDDVTPPRETITLRRGAVVRFELGFAADRIRLRVGRVTASSHGSTLRWRVRGCGGSLRLVASGRRWRVIYTARTSVRPRCSARR